MSEVLEDGTEVVFKRVAPRSGQHAVSDERTPTRYAVYVDDTLIGHVWSHSDESWRQTSSGIRYSMRGYSRDWRYQVERDGVGLALHDGFAYTRNRATALLVALAREDRLIR